MKAVKDLTFSNDGRKFLSCGYDRQMKLWDTETGQCLSRFSNGKIPYVVRFHPDDDKQNIFLAGMSDKKIVQVSFSAVGSPSRFKSLTSACPPSMTYEQARSRRNMINTWDQSTPLLSWTRTEGSLLHPTTRLFVHGISISRSQSNISPSRTCILCPQ